MKNAHIKLMKYAEQDKTKLGQRVANWLDKDNLASIQADSGVYYCELTSPSFNSMPNYIHEYIKKYMKNLGYTWLGNIKPRIERS